MNNVTLVVPIYNVERYLNECLDSFVSQTDKAFNVLLIDDGSTDKSADIAKEYAKKYPDIFTYYRQENKGLGGARNTGIKLVKTKYLMFFDSDDFMASRAMENINNIINKANEDLDIIFFNPVIYDMGTHSYEEWHDATFIKEIIGLDIAKNEEVFNPHDRPRLMETEASVCRAVWRTDFLKDIKLEFLEHTHWEDVPPHFLIMHSARKAVFMNYEGAYYYRSNTDTQITSGGGKSRLDMEKIFNVILPYFNNKEWSKNEKIGMLSFLANYLFWSINVVDDQYLPDLIKICHNFFKKISFVLYCYFFLKSKNCLRDKAMIWYLKSPLHYKTLMDRNKIKKRMETFKKIKGKIKG